MWYLRQLDSKRGQGRGLRIAELRDTCARVSNQQHAVDGHIVNDRGAINDCGDAMRSPDAVSRRSVSGSAGSHRAKCGSGAHF
jgi:hypothetical protein